MPEVRRHRTSINCLALAAGLILPLQGCFEFINPAEKSYSQAPLTNEIEALCVFQSHFDVLAIIVVYVTTDLRPINRIIMSWDFPTLVPAREQEGSSKK
jgi:hypothetical protein